MTHSLHMPVNKALNCPDDEGVASCSLYREHGLPLADLKQSINAQVTEYPRYHVIQDTKMLKMLSMISLSISLTLDIQDKPI
jgi:hypothetical protein